MTPLALWKTGQMKSTEDPKAAIMTARDIAGTYMWKDVRGGAFRNEVVENEAMGAWGWW